MRQALAFPIGDGIHITGGASKKAGKQFHDQVSMQRVSRLTRSRRSGSLIAADIVFLQVGGKPETRILIDPVTKRLMFSCQSNFRNNAYFTIDYRFIFNTGEHPCNYCMATVHSAQG